MSNITGYNPAEYEAKTLAGYAQRSANSRGRKFAEPEHKWRSPFMRDRDRIIHSSAFRRLESKTQVFVIFEGDYYRTRLTHTIEVAQISRTIARGLGLNEELAEAIALAHDLGHPPFGHTGEHTLHRLMADHGGFEHNRQGLRIVDQLETRYPGFPGLNLSFEVREGIAKHRTEYDNPEDDLFSGKNVMPTLEAQLVNLADEITYACHDVDDALKSGTITEDALRSTKICGAILDGMDNDPAMKGNPAMRHYQLIRKLIDRQVNDVLTNSLSQIADSGVKSLEDVRAAGKTLIFFSPEVAEISAELRAFLLKNFYNHPKVSTMSDNARRILKSLFEAYTEQPGLIPPEAVHSGGDATPHRIVCDYIAGMTDRYAIEEHRRLSTRHAGSLDI